MGADLLCYCTNMYIEKGENISTEELSNQVLFYGGELD